MLKDSPRSSNKFHLSGIGLPRRTLDITAVSLPLRAAFAISRGAKTEALTVRVRLAEDGHCGRAECVPYARYGESADTVIDVIEGLRRAVEAGLDRADLQKALPAGAARAALDCALWDLDAKRSGTPVWALADLPEPKPVETAMTLSLDTPSAMAAAARQAEGRVLKLKVGGPQDLERLSAVHAARPDARLILDANEGLAETEFGPLAVAAAKSGVVMIEQPFPAARDEALFRRLGPVTICADESAHTQADIQLLAMRYDAVNIKIDKAGGLTEAIAMARAARACGLGVMIGCMVASSLALAPACLLAGLADIADLDGPLWLEQDIENGLLIRNGIIAPPRRALWG